MSHPDEKPAGTKYGFPASAKGFLFPPVLWALFFVTSYSVQGAGCAMRLDQPVFLSLDAIQVTLLILASLVLAVLLAVGLWSYRAYRDIARVHGNNTDDEGVRQSRFLAAGTVLSAGLFFVACLWTGIPVLWSQSCGGLS